MIDVFLVDDHEAVRRGMKDFVEHDGDVHVVGEAATVDQAFARIPVANPQVAVVDIRLHDGNGVWLCRELRERTPEVAYVMHTSFNDEQAAQAAGLAGAVGYVLKNVRGNTLVETIRAAAAGSLLPVRTPTDALDRLFAQARQGPIRLWPEKERSLLALMSEGLTNQQIAARMFTSAETVSADVSSTLVMLGLTGRTQTASRT